MYRQTLVPNVLTFAAIGFVLLALAAAQFAAVALTQMPHAMLPQSSASSAAVPLEPEPEPTEYIGPSTVGPSSSQSSSQATVTINGETTEVIGSGTVQRSYTSNNGSSDISVTIENNSSSTAEEGVVTIE